MNPYPPTKRFGKLQLGLLLAFALTGDIVHAQQTFWLNHVDPNMIELDNNGRARTNRSTQNKPMSIGGQKFTNGIGTRASSQLMLDLQGKAQSFYAKVGVDDEVTNGNGSVVFKVVGDKKTLWQSPVMRAGDKAREIDVPLKGVKLLTLIADDNNDGNEKDDADWVDAKILCQVEPVAKLAPREPAVILTPKSPRTPR